MSHDPEFVYLAYAYEKPLGIACLGAMMRLATAGCLPHGPLRTGLGAISSRGAPRKGDGVMGLTFCRVLVLPFSIGALLPGTVSASGGSQPIDIGLAPDYQLSLPRQINNWGDIVGQASRTGEEPRQQGVVWRKNGRRASYSAEMLPPLPGSLRSEARGFVYGRIPIGNSTLPGARAVAWIRDRSSGEVVPTELEPPPGFTDAYATAGNAVGAIVGWAWNMRELSQHAVLWKLHFDGSIDICDLDVPEGYTRSVATDINQSGVIVGTASLAADNENPNGRTDVVVWRRAHRRGEFCRYDALPLPPHPDVPYATSPAISEGGHVVAGANSIPPVFRRPLLWKRIGRTHAAPEVLPIPQGFTDAQARDINVRGEILGTVSMAESPGTMMLASQAVIWKLERGVWKTLLLAQPAESTLITAEKMNDVGDVVGSSTFPEAGSSGGYLWLHASKSKCPHAKRHSKWHPPGGGCGCSRRPGR